ncbi:hypothetical protein [Streptomyces sp. VRA16 Mangrove soil]|uniref:hypothetical protein n=1 Tax=Streptomyces sp. VRA16 Mangrove soil TaxID=2817434 RepID=UPI001A9E17E4|nr:hypothetical protein [Streptomyces sp. VRA16 Mangrove soil]MBO1333269.1 hypothetical protein [Streptomyces sp. VRA16 Mangrove soil]
MRKTGKLLVTAVVLAGAAAGCTSGGVRDEGPKIPRTATGTLEQIAHRAGCARPAVQTNAAELRQANCGSGTGRWVLATFATDRGQTEWLDSADDYGGTYLVGRKWIAVGPDAVVTKLRGRLGGTVERSSSHHSGSSGGGGHEEAPGSGHTGHG